MSELALDHKDCTVTKADELRTMMKLRYPAPEYALFEEVYAGIGGTRRTDMVAMGLFPSRGLLLHGFELKVSRNDWLTELKNHAKAEEMYVYCDHWWLVVGDRNIVKDGELPPTWGLIAPRGETLATVVKAPRLKPVPLDRELFAALSRRAHEAIVGGIRTAVEAETKDLNEQLIKTERELRDAQRQIGTRLHDQVKEFEAAAGFKITEGWHGPANVGAVVKALLEHGVDHERRAAERALDTVDRIRNQLNEVLAALPPPTTS